MIVRTTRSLTLAGLAFGLVVFASAALGGADLAAQTTRPAAGKSKAGKSEAGKSEIGEPSDQEKAKKAAQKKARREQAKEKARWVALERYDRRASRLAFAACDRDGDDRLDIREVRSALAGMKNSKRFRTLDLDRNGILDWNEVDLRYRSLIRRGGTFQFFPVRPFATPPEAKAESAEAKVRKSVNFVMEMVSEDDDPHVSPAEMRALIKALSLPTATASYFAVMDTDGSGALSAEELIPIVQKVPQLLELAGGSVTTGEGDKVITITSTQLRHRLTRLHPALGRWSKEVFRIGDKDGDKQLAGEEVSVEKGEDVKPRRK